MNWFFGCQMSVDCCRMSNDFVPMTKRPDVGWVVFLGCFVMETLQLTSHNRQLAFWQLKTNSFTPSARPLVGGILTSVFVKDSSPTICRGFQPRNPRRFVGLFLSHLLDVDMRWRNHL